MNAEDFQKLCLCLAKIEPLLEPESLNLEDQATLLENARQISLILVDAVHGFTAHKTEALQINKALLGYVLSIPRLEEDPGTDMLARALHQIECINVASLDVQSYLRRHLGELKGYIAANAAPLK